MNGGGFLELESIIIIIISSSSSSSRQRDKSEWRKNTKCLDELNWFGKSCIFNILWGKIKLQHSEIQWQFFSGTVCAQGLM